MRLGCLFSIKSALRQQIQKPYNFANSLLCAIFDYHGGWCLKPTILKYKDQISITWVINWCFGNAQPLLEPITIPFTIKPLRVARRGVPKFKTMYSRYTSVNCREPFTNEVRYLAHKTRDGKYLIISKTFQCAVDYLIALPVTLSGKYGSKKKNINW